MSDPLALPGWQAARLAVLLDALGDPPLGLPELASLAWLAGQDITTVENIAQAIRRARGADR
jgi:hypothetical protein